ncbi:hypothetical protein AB3S75_032446 [Citrus x aurantiifolia]
MGASMGMGFMAVFAVSGSVVLVASQVHKRLLSDFMKRIESEICGPEKYHEKKRVRFADDVVEPSGNNKEYRKRNSMSKADEFVKMPLNRQILYKGMIQNRTLQSQNCM